MGKLIANASPEVRKELYIATKCTYSLAADFIFTQLMSTDLGIPAAGHFFLFRPAILTAIDLSLKRLGVDSIDLYMVSFFTRMPKITHKLDTWSPYSPLFRVDGRAVGHCIQSRNHQGGRSIEFQQRRAVRVPVPTSCLD